MPGSLNDRPHRGVQPLPEHGPGLGDLAAFDGAPITQPSQFVGGVLDASTTWLAAAIEAYPVTLPGLISSRILDGCGHWIQQERPAEVNRILIEWLAVSAAAAPTASPRRETT